MGTQRAVKVKHRQNVQVEATAPTVLPKINSTSSTPVNVVARHKVKAGRHQNVRAKALAGQAPSPTHLKTPAGTHAETHPETPPWHGANDRLPVPTRVTHGRDSLATVEVSAEALAATMPLTLPAAFDSTLPPALAPAAHAAAATTRLHNLEAPTDDVAALRLAMLPERPRSDVASVPDATAEMFTAELQSQDSVTRMVREDAALDRRIIDGMLNDRDHFLSAMTQEGFSSNAILRRAAELGLSEALVRQVKGVAADLAGERPGRRPAPAALGARTCLSCDRVFLSSGPGNRLCMRCRGGDAGLAQL